MIDGTFEHHDSAGGGGLITNGATQWMTAGSGILHIERPPDSLVATGGLFHVVQLWVNLAAADKWLPPAYQDIAPGAVSLLRSPDGGALVRVIAGAVAGYEGPGSTHSPISLLHVTSSPGARLELPWPSEYNALVYVLSGSGGVGPEDRPVRTGQLAVLGAGDVIALRASPTQDAPSPNLETLVLGGRPIGEPVAAYGPFVMNTDDELRQAFDDFNAGRMGSVPSSESGH
jgi:redox-sensitive bicupin YhaK (pirin superfamily)